MNLQQHPVTAGVPQGPIVYLTFFLLYTPNDVNCNISICVDDSTLYSKYDEESNLWQQVEFASEPEPDLQDTVDCGRKGLVYFNAGKIQLVLFGQCNNPGSIDVKRG